MQRVHAGELEGVPEASSGEGTEFEVMIVNDKVSIKSHLGKYLTVPRSADRSDHHTRTVERQTLSSSPPPAKQ